MICESVLTEWCNRASEVVAVHNGDPTPDEIARMTAAIRAGWSDEERSKRLRWDWRPQQIKLSAGSGDELRHQFLIMED